MDLKIFYILLFVVSLSAIPQHHLYETGASVPLHVVKIGPYSNPSESYDYYSLPLCRPDKLQKISQNLGEKIEGDSTYTSPYVINYKEDISGKILCTKNFTKDDIQQLAHAIENYFYFEFEIDKIPLRGFIGTVETEITATGEQHPHFYLFKHMHFIILYNDKIDPKKGVVIYANITSDLDRVKELKYGSSFAEVEFTYSVKWEPSTIKFEDRLKFWHDNFFFRSSSELEIHWLSILNSFVLVILLTSFLAIIIMRILKSDYSRYEKITDGDDQDYGWKRVAGDVFRFPPLKSVFCSFIGVGAQFVLMMTFIIILALVGLYYPGNEGNLQLSAVVLYALTAGVSGFVSNYLYNQMGGTSWTWNVILTATIFAAPFVFVAFVINTVAVSWRVTQALPVWIILLLVTIWLFVGFPLTLIGGITGKRLAPPFSAPVRTKTFPREIPPLSWFRRLPFQMAMAGFLPFSAIYIELFYIYNSVWGRSSYQLWGILCLVFIILLLVTACITVALTYFQLASEDYRWWWHSFLCGGSTGIFIYIYSIFYYIFRSSMTGFLQAAFYFGYMAVICYFFFIMLGSVGFFCSLLFVKEIFKHLHFD